MKGWKLATLVVVLTAAAGVGAAVSPVALGQSKAVRVQAPVAIDFLKGGSRIGISTRDLEQADEKTAKGASTGVLVEEVLADSPAETAGMRKGDVLVEFDGERVRSARQLARLVQETPAGRSVSAALLRDGQRTTVTVTPREGNQVSFQHLEDLSDWAQDFRYRVAPVPKPPAAPKAPAPPAPPSVWGFGEFMGSTSRLGVTLQSLSPQLAEYFGTKEGVLVTSVTDDSAAAKAGLKAGDVITAFNGSPVDQPQAVRRRVQDLDDGAEFTIEVMRDRKPVTVKGKAERPEPRRGGRTIL
jgi:S1-C subfamily serine protease